MKHRVAVLPFVVLCLTAGGCDLVSDGSNSRAPSAGFSNEPGPILFFTGGAGASGLYSMNPDGSDVRLLASDELEGFWNPRWSPDGGRIVMQVERHKSTEPHAPSLRFLRFVSSTGQDVYDCQLTGSAHLVWRADSRTVLSGTGGTEEAGELIDAESCAATSFELSGNVPRTEFTDWSKPGLQLLGATTYTVRDDAGDLVSRTTRMTVWTEDGDSLFSVGRVGERYQGAKWSNGGDYIAVGIVRGKDQSVYRMAPDGSHQVQLTGYEFYFAEPVAWSADDNRILVHAKTRPGSGRLSQSRILLVDANGEGIADVSPFPNQNNVPTSWRTN